MSGYSRSTLRRLGHTTCLFAMLVLGFSSEALMRLKYNELQIKNYDEMTEMVNGYIQKAQESAIQMQEEGDSETGDRLAIEELNRAMLLILSRPDKDNLVGKLMPPVKKELLNYNAYTQTANAIATDAISSLDMKKLPVVYRATSIFVLENLMSEIKPEIGENQALLDIVKKIKKADIEVSKDVKNHRKLTGMYRTTSPSKTAKMILKRHKKTKTKGKKKKKDDDD